MKKITINLYSFNELSQKAKDKARADYNAESDYPFLRDTLEEDIKNELNALGYTYDDIVPFYSLSYSQGDGLMFEGTVNDKSGNIYTIKHSGHYYHERSTTIEGIDSEGNEIDSKDFEDNVYIPICVKVADMGYAEMQFQDSEEQFAETCEANDYTFEQNGRMNNVKDNE